jgi:ribosomal protein S18 acetylase RimI-like enzyme
MATSVAVRRLAPDDWPLYRDLRLAALEDAPHAFGTRLEDERRNAERDWRERLERRAVFAAFHGPAPAGLTVGIPWGDDPTSAYLTAMWVDPEHRGRGLGDALVVAVLDWSRDEGFEAVRLWVSDGNEPAERLYARHGFTRTGATQSIRPGEPGVEFEMRHRLAAST